MGTQDPYMSIAVEKCTSSKIEGRIMKCHSLGWKGRVSKVPFRDCR